MTQPQQKLLATANLLPKDAARLLMGLEPKWQVQALNMLALIVDYWEQEGVQLDPIQLDVVLRSFVIAITPTLEMLHQMATKD